MADGSAAAGCHGDGMPDFHDVIVIGAGSAGTLLAAELSADPDRSVLLLEAGPDHRSADTPDAIRSPNCVNAMLEPGRTWPALTATRTARQAEATYLRGRGAGGSSSINGLALIRGTPEDYDRWERELGCTGWGWPAMLEAFLAIEDDRDYGGDGVHGKGGPLPLWRVPFDELSPLDRALREAGAAFGHADGDDYHADGATGFARYGLTLADGRRVSTNDAYLEPVRDRANLEVRGETLVDRLLVEGRRVVGIRAAGGEELLSREVIVSAGAIHSPAILLRSGIGVADGLRVGQNLRDHPCTQLALSLRTEGRVPSADGPFITSLLRFSSGLFDAGANDLQLSTASATTGEASLWMGAVIGSLFRVFSSGSVSLRSDDPLVDPVVELNMLSDARDLVRLRHVFRHLVELVRHPAVERIVEGVVAMSPLLMLFKPLDDLVTDDEIDEWLLASVGDEFHASGTCRMGAPGDPAAVVDPTCRVLGYEGVRVCDASVMPDVPRANTNLTTLAIAQRVAWLIDGR